MGRIEDELATIFGYIFMFLMILRIVIATDFFHIYKSLIGFMFALILFYTSKRVVYIEKAKEGGHKHENR